MNARATLKINNKGHLEIGGTDTVELVKKFPTPIYVFDERYIRDMCRAYRNVITEQYDGNGIVLFASKAFSCKAIYKIIASENLGCDVVSGGELYTAIQADFPTEKIYMHGNNKLKRELIEALDNKIGCIVVDSFTELDLLDKLAGERNVVQDIIVRVNPGIEAHTHHFVQTATTDSKFGFSLTDGTAENITKYALKKKNVRLSGYHCHIGSQIFEKQSFTLAVDKMIDFMAEMKDKYAFSATKLNMGGGYGVWYTDEDKKISPEGYAEYLKAIISEIKIKCGKYNIKLPYLVIEPGRSIVAEAGITLYTVGNIKEIPNVKKYVAVDGGMFDNPRYALYQAKYTAILANRANDKATETVSVAGKCCESGDVICADVKLPQAKTGDILAVLSTGAYNYSMASNYNRNFIPGVVLVNDGNAEYIVKPQTYEDVTRNDIIPERLK